MSKRLQYDFHPDADQIGAFVEQALPAHEREQMLDHLAICPECRAIVALSLPEVEHTATPVPQPARKPWWPEIHTRWVLAWPLAGAVVAAAFFFVFIHRVSIPNQAPSQQQVAISQTPTQPAAGEQPPAKAKKPELRNLEPRISKDRGAASVTTAAGNPNPDVKSPIQAIGGPVLKGRNLAPLIRPSEAPATKAPGVSNGVHGVGFGSGSGAGLSIVPSFAVAGQMQKTAPAQPGGTAIAAPPPQTTAAAAPSPAETVALTSAEPKPAESSNLASFEISTDQVQLRQIRQALPSRLPILSMATEGNLIVAIDTHNAVFLSDDAGGHWKPIHAPWQGRAVKAGLVVAPAGNHPEYAEDKALSTEETHIAGALSAKSLNNALSAPTRPPSGLPAPSLAGTVTDPTGAVIPGASVVATDSATGTARTVVADSAGHYLIDGLAAGKYRVEARAPGFMKQELAAVVTGSKPTEANLTLNIGAASQTVSVQAAAQATIDTQTLPPESPQKPVFEITTEGGERWTSTDGVTWNHADQSPKK